LGYHLTRSRHSSGCSLYRELGHTNIRGLGRRLGLNGIIRWWPRRRPGLNSIIGASSMAWAQRHHKLSSGGFVGGLDSTVSSGGFVGGLGSTASSGEFIGGVGSTASSSGGFVGSLGSTASLGGFVGSFDTRDSSGGLVGSLSSTQSSGCLSPALFSLKSLRGFDLSAHCLVLWLAVRTPGRWGEGRTAASQRLWRVLGKPRWKIVVGLDMIGLNWGATELEGDGACERG
jgi:hypothetical protein